MADDWRQRISISPDVCHGKAVIAGTRIPVAVILANLGDGLSPERVIESFPSVSVADVSAALRFAAELAQDRFIPFAERAAG